MNQFIRFPIQIISSGIIEFMHTSHFRVYACLDSHKNRKSQAFPSLETIHKETKLNRHTIQRAIKDLIEWGLIKKAYIRREKGKGYRTIYTLPQEPSIKKPLKRIKDEILNSARRKRDSKGRFLDIKQPHQRTVLNSLKQPHDMATLKKNSLKQPHRMAATNKPHRMANPKSTDMANNQSYISSNYPVKKNPQHNNPQKGKKPKSKPNIDTSEKAWTKQVNEILTGKKKAKKAR